MIKVKVIDCCDNLCKYNVIEFRCPYCEEVIEDNKLYSNRFDCIYEDFVIFNCSCCKNELKMIFNDKDAEFYILKNK